MLVVDTSGSMQGVPLASAIEAAQTVRSPDPHSTFSVDGDGLYTATTDSAADGHMDLLTVVLHEMGHLLGLEHGDSGADGLMSETLEDSTRIVHITDTQKVAMVGDSTTDAGESLLWLQMIDELYYRDKRGNAGAAREKRGRF